MDVRERPRTYRTRLALRLAVGLAACVWAAALVVLLRLPARDPRLVVGAAALVLFFAASTVVYERKSITVTRAGIVAASAFRGQRPIAWDEILQVVVRDGLGGREYAVVTRRGPVHFTSLVARHRELFEILLERAGLQPRFA